MVRLALVLLVCAACFADNPPVLGSGSGASDPTTTGVTTTTAGSSGEATATTDGASGTGSTGSLTAGSTGSATTSGGPDTTASDTTGGPSTSGEPGTTTRGTSVGGTTGPLMWDDCKTFDSQVDCIGCCGQVIEASKVYYAAFAACLCAQGSPCMQVCGLDLCLFGQANAACLECAAGPGAACQTAAVNKCQDDPDCGAFLECAAENNCDGKP